MKLSTREQEILPLLLLTNQQIAEHMGISRRTVEIHVARIIRKLGVRTRYHALQEYLNNKNVVK